MELSLYNQTGNHGNPNSGQNGIGPAGANAAGINSGNPGGGAPLGDQDNGNLGSSQFNGMPISAASLNAMMAGAQGGQAGAASALSQFSGAAGMFPSSMITSNGMAGLSGGAASMFPGGGGGMGGMGVGVGGMNGMSLNPNALGLGSAGSIQNPAAFTMAGRSPLFLSNGGNSMGLNGSALGGQFGQGGNGMMNLNGSSLLSQLPNNGDLSGSNDKLLGAPDGSVPGGVPGGPTGPGPNGIPTSLLKYYNLHQNLPSVLMENEPSERPYRDHALVPDDPSITRNGRRTSTGKDKGGSNFPAKLHEILSRTDISDIISWAPHGRAWRVLKPKAFEEKIIPKYFRHCKYNSFTRQVNGWGFRRITQGPDHNAYFHELFLRGLPHLCKRMRRLTASSNSRSDLVSSIEPDFYSMSKISPLPAIGSGVESHGALGDKLRLQSNADGDEDGDKDPTATKSNDSATLKSDRGKLEGDDSSGGAGLDRSLGGAGSGGSHGNVVTPEMLNEMQHLRSSGDAGGGGPSGDPSGDGNSNDFSQLDSVTRHQLLQAQYLNSMNMNMRQDSLQQQILAQQSLLNSLQGQYPGAGALSQLGGSMGMGMGMGMGSQMPSLMGAGAPMGASSFPNQGGLLGSSNQNGMNPGSNLQFY